MSELESTQPDDGHELARQARLLRRAVDQGLVSPRDAAIYAGTSGLTAIDVKHTEVADLHGVAERRSRQVASTVERVLLEMDTDAAESTEPRIQNDSDEAWPIVL